MSEQIGILALALLAYEGSVAIGGNGFIAAFAGGILFGAATKGRLEAPTQFTETLGLAASFLVWAIFGGLFVGKLFTEEFSAQPIIYAVLSLTLIRMVPVALVLWGTHLRPATVAFMGWFGPRGLASVVFTLIALEDLEHANGGTLLAQTATWTVLLSVVLHGLSASPLAARYGASMARRAHPGAVPAGEPGSACATWRAAIASRAAGPRRVMSRHSPGLPLLAGLDARRRLPAAGRCPRASAASRLVPMSLEEHLLG